MASQQIWASLWFGTAMLLVFSFRVVGQDTQRTGTIKSSVERLDAKACLRAARAALERGDLDCAETLTAEAEKAPLQFASSKRWWADTPAKMWRDIQAARTGESAALIKRIQDQEKMNGGTPPPASGNIVAIVKREPEDWEVFPLPLPAGLEPAWVQIAGRTVSTVQTLRDLAVFQDKFLGRPASAEPPLLEIVGGPISTILTPRDSAVFQQKLAGLEEKSQALLLLAEAGKAIVAGNTAIAREYTRQARNLRPSSSWNQKDLVQLRAYLQRHAGAGPGRPAEKKVSPPPSLSQAPPIDKKPAVKDSGLDLVDQVTTGELQAPPPESADEDEGEPAAEPRNKTTPGSFSGWFVVPAVAAILLLGVALRKLYLGPIVKTGTTSN